MTLYNNNVITLFSVYTFATFAKPSCDNVLQTGFLDILSHEGLLANVKTMKNMFYPNIDIFRL